MIKSGESNNAFLCPDDIQTKSLRPHRSNIKILRNSRQICMNAKYSAQQNLASDKGSRLLQKIVLVLEGQSLWQWVCSCLYETNLYLRKKSIAHRNLDGEILRQTRLRKRYINIVFWNIQFLRTKQEVFITWTLVYLAKRKGKVNKIECE